MPVCVCALDYWRDANASVKIYGTDLNVVEHFTQFSTNAK